MDKKDVMAFVNAHPDCFFATMDGDKPRVRPIGTLRADENGIVFSFQSDKDVYKQVSKNPNVEICYYFEHTQVRISGRLQESKDLALRKWVVEKRPFLQPGVDKIGWDYVGVFILKHGRAAIIEANAPAGSPKAYVDL
jgi:pyridoxamine 5'-phosphate oxidase